MDTPQNQIPSHYTFVVKAFYDEDGSVRIVIRQYDMADGLYYLVLNPYTYKLNIRDSKSIDLSKTVQPVDFQNTPYAKALLTYTSPPYRLQNYGVVQANSTSGQFFLTVDLCPSKKPLDKELFKRTMELHQGRDEAVPVAVAISGLWIRRHPQDLEWLRSQMMESKLNIIWINHSYSHTVVKGNPLEQNYLLTPGVEFKREVLRLEKMLLKNGLMPSPFFRFPCLVSNEQLIEELKALSLIPIGTNAWLAKGESPHGGCIILLHGNGNDPKGIEILFSFYRRRKADFKAGKVVFRSIEEAF